MSIDHYARSGRRWATGATLVYGPIAAELVALSPHQLEGRRVLDVGAGTGVASGALLDRGARPVAVDLSYAMLAWGAPARPPGAVADVLWLPLVAAAVDDTVAAFVLNHLTEPQRGMAELARVTAPGGAVLACVYSNASRSPARDAIDAFAAAEGWVVPAWYTEIKARATPLLGTAADMSRAAHEVGLVDVRVGERPVDVGVTRAEQLVDYRFGQAHYTDWLDELGPERAEGVRAGAADAIRPIMAPYQPTVVFLAGRIPHRP